MSPACEIMNSLQTFHDYRQLQVITEYNYDCIKFGESVITIMITIVISPNPALYLTKGLVKELDLISHFAFGSPQSSQP